METIAISTSFVTFAALSILQRYLLPPIRLILNPVWVRNYLVSIDVVGAAIYVSSYITNLTFWVRSKLGKAKDELEVIQWTTTSALIDSLVRGA